MTDSTEPTDTEKRMADEYAAKYEIGVTDRYEGFLAGVQAGMRIENAAIVSYLTTVAKRYRERKSDDVWKVRAAVYEHAAEVIATRVMTEAELDKERDPHD